MSGKPEDDLFDDLFHGCAFAAFVEQAIAEGGPPCPEKTRQLAYRFYEEALAEKAMVSNDDGNNLLEHRIDPCYTEI